MFVGNRTSARRNVVWQLNEDENTGMATSGLPHILSNCFKELIDYKMVGGVMISALSLMAAVCIVTNLSNSPPTERR